MKIHVISLKRSANRRTAFQKANRHIDFEFFDGFDGVELAGRRFFSPIKNRKIFAADLEYTPGAQGCALSHIALWDRCISTGRPLTVVEDDAVLRHDFQQAHEAALASLGKPWDIVMWGWNFDSVLALTLMGGVSPTAMVFDQEQMRRNLAEFQQQSEAFTLLRLKNCLGIPAYSISPAGAARLKDLCLPLAPLAIRVPLIPNAISNTGIDIPMNRHFAALEAYAAFPPLALTANEASESTIGPR